MEIEQAFGEVLRATRNKSMISQEKLAHICNLDRTYISLLERGKRKPTINTLFALAEALKTQPSTLIKQVEEIKGFKV